MLIDFLTFLGMTPHTMGGTFLASEQEYNLKYFKFKNYKYFLKIVIGSLDSSFREMVSIIIKSKAKSLLSILFK